MNRQHPEYSPFAQMFDALVAGQRERARLEKLYGKPPYDELIELHVEPVELPDLGIDVWIDAIADVTKHESITDPDAEIHGYRIVGVGDADREYQLDQLTERDRKAIDEAIEKSAWNRIS